MFIWYPWYSFRLPVPFLNAAYFNEPLKEAFTDRIFFIFLRVPLYPENRRTGQFDTLDDTVRSGCRDSETVPEFFYALVVKGIYSQRIRFEVDEQTAGAVYGYRVVHRSGQVFRPVSQYSIHLVCQRRVESSSGNDIYQLVAAADAEDRKFVLQGRPGESDIEFLPSL